MDKRTTLLLILMFSLSSTRGWFVTIGVSSSCLLTLLGDFGLFGIEIAPSRTCRHEHDECEYLLPNLALFLQQTVSPNLGTCLTERNPHPHLAQPCQTTRRQVPATGNSSATTQRRFSWSPDTRDTENLSFG